MRLILTCLLTIWGGQALAHVGHIADVAGHGHWVGAAAIGLAVLAGLYGKRKGEDAVEAEEEDDAEPQEVPA